MIRLLDIGVSEAQLRLDIREEVAGRFGKSVHESMKCTVCGRRVIARASHAAPLCTMTDETKASGCVERRLRLTS